MPLTYRLLLRRSPAGRLPTVIRPTRLAARMPDYGLIGKMTALPGRREDLIEALIEASRLIRDAKGLHSWLVHADVEDADAVWITEIWDDQESHDASLGLPGVRDHIMATMPLLAGAPRQGTVLRPIGGVGLPSSSA